MSSKQVKRRIAKQIQKPKDSVGTQFVTNMSKLLFTTLFTRGVLFMELIMGCKQSIIINVLTAKYVYKEPKESIM